MQKNMLASHTCYRVKFSHSASKGVHINRKEPPKLGVLGPRPLVVGAQLTRRNMPLLVTAKFGRSRSNGTNVIKEIRLKIWSLAFRLLRSHSKSSEPTLITSYLRSIATMDPSRTVCDIIGNFGQKLQFFS